MLHTRPAPRQTVPSPCNHLAGEFVVSDRATCSIAAGPYASWTSGLQFETEAHQLIIDVVPRGAGFNLESPEVACSSQPDGSSPALDALVADPPLTAAD